MPKQKKKACPIGHAFFFCFGDILIDDHRAGFGHRKTFEHRRLRCNTGGAFGCHLDFKFDVTHAGESLALEVGFQIEWGGPHAWEGREGGPLCVGEFVRGLAESDADGRGGVRREVDIPNDFVPGGAQVLGLVAFLVGLAEEPSDIRGEAELLAGHVGVGVWGDKTGDGGDDGAVVDGGAGLNHGRGTCIAVN